MFSNSCHPLDRAGVDRLRLWDCADFAMAVSRGEVELLYQPQVDAARGVLVGVEALARWNSPTFGAVSPIQFVSALEDADRVELLWEAVLSCAKRDYALLTQASAEPIHLALNVSALQLAKPEFIKRFANWLDRHGIDSSRIHVEITESALLYAGPATRRNLEALVELGVELWLDDFGTGYSGLRHLRELPITGLKIDKSFVDDIESGIDDFRIVSAITAMSCSLGLRVVAEGVETETQMQILTQLGCTTLQGYLIGKPQSMKQLHTTWSRMH